MIKVLQIIDNMNIGGMESMLMNYYKNMDRKKIQYDFLIFHKEKCFYEDEIKYLGGNVFKITPRRKNPVLNFNELKRFFENNSYDIVEIHQGVTYLLPIRLAKKYGVKRIIIHSHGVDGKYKKGLYNIYRKKVVIPYLNKNATDFFACSELITEDLFNQERCQAKNYYLINNSVDVTKFMYNEKIRSSVRKDLNIEKDFVVGHVGRFHYQKNQDFIIQLANKIPNFKFVLIGEGEDFEKIKKIAPDNVILYGASSKVNYLMQAFDVFILPSRWEGLPLVGVEAQAAGLPVVLSENITKETDITGNALFLPLNLEIWMNELNKLRNYNRKDTSKIIENSGYDSKTEAKKLEKIYEKILYKNKK